MSIRDGADGNSSIAGLRKRINVLRQVVANSRFLSRSLIRNNSAFRILFRIVFYGFLLVAISVPLAWRVCWEGQAELTSAKEAFEQGDRERQVLHLGRAARWRLPFASHDDRALAALIRMASLAEDDPDLGRDFALVVYREARRAILATRAWGLPSRENFDLINHRIAYLMAEQEREYQTDLSGVGQQEQYHLQLLQQVPGPPSRGSFFASVCFVLWAASLFGFVTQAIDIRGNIKGKRAVAWGCASLLFLVTWAILTRFPEAGGSFEDSQSITIVSSGGPE